MSYLQYIPVLFDLQRIPEGTCRFLSMTIFILITLYYLWRY